MGREIRRVPVNWVHPTDERGNLQPCYDETFEDAAQKWLNNLLAWERGEHPDRKRVEREYGYRYYWEWEGDPPDKEYYRPAFDSEPTAFQIYETVSEGTPVSPVFETKEQMIEWLIKQGHSKESAEGFAKSEWAPSMIITGGKLYSGIDSCALQDG